MSQEFPPRVVLVSASKCPLRYFDNATLLGRSLQQFPDQLKPEILVLTENIGPNSRGLSDFYNEAIDTIEGDAIVAFVHDDVFIHDWNLRFTLSQALCFWDIVGVVGSSGVAHGQPSWTYEINEQGVANLSRTVTRSGCVNHFDHSHAKADFYGPAPMQCDLLDGMFLAADLQRLRSKELRFDPEFRFHCYDSAFCYRAQALGLSIGTWPITLTHGSWGSFDPIWLSIAIRLRNKLMAATPEAAT